MTLTRRLERNYMGDEFLALYDELNRIAEVTNYNGMRLFANCSTVNAANADPKSAADATTIWDAAADAVFGANDNGGATHFNMMVGQNYTADDIAAYNGGAQLNSYDKTAENMITIQLGQMDGTALFTTNANTAVGLDYARRALVGIGGTVNPFENTGVAFQTTRWGPTTQTKLTTILELIDGEAPSQGGGGHQLEMVQILQVLSE